MPLTTLAAAKAYIGITGSGQDAILQPIVDGVIKMALFELNGRTFSAAELTKRLDGTGLAELLLPQYPINAVASVRVDPSYVFPASSELTEDEDFIVREESGILEHLGDGWPIGRKNIRVTWTPNDEVPADLKMVLNDEIAWFYNRQKQVEGGQAPNEMLSEDVGDRSETYRAEMTAAGLRAPTLAVLRKYSDKSV